MTFGQLFTAMHPDVRVIENGSCVWLFMDEGNHYTIANEWWNQEVTDYALEKNNLYCQTVSANLTRVVMCGKVFVQIATKKWNGY